MWFDNFFTSDKPWTCDLVEQNIKLLRPFVQMMSPEINKTIHQFLQTRNTALDTFFYDVTCLSEDEKEKLAHFCLAEGTILLIGPSNDPLLKTWNCAESFLSEWSAPINAITVTGVGSSAFGSAAFARNVANALGGPVIAVVSGYGMMDLLSEATGGAFLYGHLNNLRYISDKMGLDQYEGEGTAGTHEATLLARLSPDVQSLTTILKSDFEIPFLVGHSKGNLIISEGLFALSQNDRKRRGKKSHVITFSAKIAMPKEMKKVTDIIGARDWLGYINSRLCIEADERVPFSGHSTNSKKKTCFKPLYVTQELSKLPEISNLEN